MTVKLSKREDEQHLSEEIVEMNFAARWQVKATRDEEDGVGDHDDLSIYREKLQQRRLHEHSQPLQQMGEAIEEIQKLMI
jgi:hypothetical protein